MVELDGASLKLDVQNIKFRSESDITSSVFVTAELCRRLPLTTYTTGAVLIVTGSEKL
jgi:hypothetical protein